MTASLLGRIEGNVYLPGEAGYEVVRLPWRRNVDPRPSIVAQPADASGVQAVVRAARDAGLALSVQATGHGTLSCPDGGVLLNTSLLADVRVDPARQVAVAGAGATWEDVCKASTPYGLAPLSGTSPAVSVAGYTLGGGVGWLGRKYGLAADSLLRAEVVDAQGLSRVAGHGEDLLWALRGGSGNFGVLTELEFRLYPVDEMYGGSAFYPVDRAETILRAFGEHAAEDRDELTVMLVLIRLPDLPQLPEPLRGKAVLGIRACYAGPADQAEFAMAPLLAAAGEPVLGGFGPMRFADTARLAAPHPGPQLSEEYAGQVESLSDSVRHALLAEITDTRSPVTVVEIRHWGGALADPPPDHGPATPRGAHFSIVAVAPELSAQTIPAAQDRLARLAGVLEPETTGAAFLNFLSDTTKTRTAYRPEDYARLARLKRIHDPDNVLRFNHNIPPEL
ncbi:FAD-binding oxidoreductase [Kibdelosporangium aridum]|uniref:FAD-binding oxidoreductase n=1 Tax=Kibdelosporangium aridum TaxID=2030 RepID=A0A428YCA6_KIBAR|nr:FAD-binding oxidoreductase [Kibdelosporangium aridum]RSM65253.1 FAD-binding oxidoreductase [Kibdelosporangium aridum]